MQAKLRIGGLGEKRPFFFRLSKQNEESKDWLNFVEQYFKLFCVYILETWYFQNHIFNVKNKVCLRNFC